MQLTAEGLSAQRGGKILFSGLSFCLQAGQILTLSGANGAGKSTLLRMLAGLYPPLAGRVTLQTAGGMVLPRAVFSHYLSDKNAMKPQLSVWENLRFWQRFFAADTPAETKGGKAQAETEEDALRRALRRVKMDTYADLPFAALSTGQKRRAALSRLLACPRPLWLLDEPTSGLDQAGHALFAEICRAHLDTGGLIVAATHLPLGLPADYPLRIENYKPKTRQAQFYDPLNADTPRAGRKPL